MNNGSWIDFSKSGCYSTIYTLFLLIMTMSLKFFSDNLGQSSLPSMSQKSWGKSQVLPTFLYATADGSAPSGPICTIFLLVIVKAHVQKLSKFYQNPTKYLDMAAKKPIFWWWCASCRIRFLNPLWPNSCNFFLRCLGRCMFKKPPSFTRIWLSMQAQWPKNWKSLTPDCVHSSKH